ncbi:protein NPAT [Plectropomus leopardus]|uniref:protein NPAT n=1 Tax=Plectropomus leopardus TaxID=160734 RepID=UPI001C4AE245|nr:protein NPAT [Plectropomus leopardus]
MLLPSDVARLVLGYLQEEGLSATARAFIHESTNLKEYAEHTTEDGTIPACVFSVFGKGLTTILNEYVAAKTKESCHEVPAMMTSLWKKLDFTLNQIKSLQNSPSISAIQRTRSRIGVANMARQRVLTVASAGGVICSTVSETSSIISPALTSHSMLSHSTPVSYTAAHTRPAISSGSHLPIHDTSRFLNTPSQGSPIQVVVSEQRLNTGPMSPGRRKWDTPRKRGGAQSGSSAPGRCAMTVSTPNAEPQPEEAVDENFPQLVIQSARDKILGDRSLQEKLAENINKILANEPTPQSTKAPSSTVEADQSIDEILGLQGEIHMSDDAIHDILEQTESDPAFHALFELFDYNKTKFPESEAGDGDISNSPEESDAAGPSSTVGPLQSDEPGTTFREANALDTVKMRAGQERKTRKSTAPIFLKKTILGPSGRASRIENSSAKLLVSHGEHRGVSSAAVDTNRKEKASLFNNSVFVTPMDIDESLNTPPPPADNMATEDSTSITSVPTETTPLPSAAYAVPEATSNVDKKQQHEQAQGTKVQSAIAPPTFLFPLQVEQNNTPTQTADLPHSSLSRSGRDTPSGSAFLVTPESASCTSASSSATLTTVSASLSSVSAAAPFTATPGLATSASTSTTLTAAPASSSSCAPEGAAPDPATSSQATPGKAAADSSNIVSLKIIITDNQDEESSSDKALSQAISSISGDKIPTIYLSSPAKSSGVPGTPKANLDEAAQAVSGLQSSEGHASPLSCKAGALLASPLSGTSQAQQNYIIQLPLDATNTALQGAAASYIFLTEPPTTDRQLLLSAGVSKGQPLHTNQYGMTTPTRSRGFSTGSTLILPSPVKPVMLPVSVVGQNTVGKVQMVSNQLVAIPKPVQQSETVKPKSPTMAMKRSPAGTEQHHVGKLAQPVSTGNTGQQDTAKGSTHRRILCFDSSAEVQPQTAKTTRTTTTPATNTSPSQSVHQTEKDDTQSVMRTRPAILGGNKPKRRVEIIRCSADPQTGGGFMKDAEKSMPPQQHQKDPLKKNSRKQDHSIHTQESQSASTSKVDASQPETLKKSESGRISKSIDRKHNHDKDGDAAKAKDSHSSRSSSSDSAPKSGTRKEKEESSRKEPAEKAPGKAREGRTEKRQSSQEVPNVTANKENEIKGGLQEQQSTASSSALRDLSPPPVPQPASNTQSKATKAPSKTSSLAKQAAEMLQDIQGLGSPSTPVKRPTAGSSDHTLSRTLGTGPNQEVSPERPRTPSRHKKGKDGEGTPKHLMPPNTPDIPTCSPASEAGSENSINMAAHTLMILSRAAIARTGTPLKDSLRQEEVGENSATSSKNSKKRKLSSPTASPSAKKESKHSPSKKKDRERKKLVECFPHDLDVDKFLSSLHYDE